jgi:DNA invertase Pin-like site-specific DNA recombinase
MNYILIIIGIKKIESIFYNVGIYCRLSLDDGSAGESGSIQTQKMMLEKYYKDNHYTFKEAYTDKTIIK